MTRQEYGRAYQEGLDRTIRLLISRGVERECAADLAQTAWARGWERLEQLRDEKMVLTWVNSIALNCHRRLLRKERPYEELTDVSSGKLAVNFAALDISRLLRFCRPNDRNLLEAQMEGVTAEEMAQREGVSPTAIRIKLWRARRAARELLETPGSRRVAALCMKQARVA